MEITIESIIVIVTALVTYVFGRIVKKFNLYDSDYIPVQNLVVGIISGLICYGLRINNMNLLTSIVICWMGAFGAGGLYDLTRTGGKD